MDADLHDAITHVLSAVDCPDCQQPKQPNPRATDDGRVAVPGWVCLTRACPSYYFAVERQALGRPRPTRPRQSATPGRTRPRTLKPGEAVVRYNDGSSYHLPRIMSTRRQLNGGGLQLIQALPARAKVEGTIEHLIPAFNVDVVSWRRRDVPDWLIDKHDHCPHCGDHHDAVACPHAPTLPWWQVVWEWLWR